MNYGRGETLATDGLFGFVASIKPIESNALGSTPARSAVFNRVTSVVNPANRLERVVLQLHYLRATAEVLWC